ncbi:hypothetical protein [Burkholderia guangdongensis]|uniref:hypothetical protein n=1 Tax=Burkholderia guangdongensis TaxID=1792500 RepID=UPI0015CA9F88|nr:hypothetical protein [Burkholderia guangdongensis]
MFRVAGQEQANAANIAAQFSLEFNEVKQSSSGYRKTFDNMCDGFLRMAANTYQACTGKDEFDFLDTVYYPLLRQHELDPRAMQREYLKNKRPDYMDTFRLACAYRSAATHAFNSGDGGTAWTFLCRANYYLGRTQTRAMQPVVVARQVGKELRTKISDRTRAGGDAKNIARNLAVQRARQLVAASPNLYSSASQAAGKLQDQINSYIQAIYDDKAQREQYGIQSKPQKFASSTIRRWFDGIDFKSKQ